MGFKINDFCLLKFFGWKCNKYIFKGDNDNLKNFKHYIPILFSITSILQKKKFSSLLAKKLSIGCCLEQRSFSIKKEIRKICYFWDFVYILHFLWRIQIYKSYIQENCTFLVIGQNRLIFT